MDVNNVIAFPKRKIENTSSKKKYNRPIISLKAVLEERAYIQQQMRERSIKIQKQLYQASGTQLIFTDYFGNSELSHQTFSLQLVPGLGYILIMDTDNLL